MTTGPMMYGANNDAGNTETYLVCTSLAQTLAVQNRNPDSSSIIVSGTRTGLWGHTTDAGQLPEFRAGVRGSAVLTVGVLGHSGTGKGVWGK